MIQHKTITNKFLQYDNKNTFFYFTKLRLLIILQINWGLPSAVVIRTSPRSRTVVPKRTALVSTSSVIFLTVNCQILSQFNRQNSRQRHWLTSSFRLWSLISHLRKHCTISLKMLIRHSELLLLKANILN